MGDKRQETRLARLAGRQHGVVSVAQLETLGYSRRAMAKRARAGTLHRIHRGVYAVGHSRLTFRGRCMAAVLACGPGAVVSQRAAAALWNLLPHAAVGVRIDVTVPRSGGRRKREGIEVHHATDLTGATTTQHGIPVTRPARTLRDLKRSGPRELYLRVFRRAVDRRLIEPPQGPADELTRSELERRFLGLCRRHRIPAPEVNARVGGFEVDFLWCDHGLVVETDGYEFHGGRSAFERDRARDAALEALGLRTLRFSYVQVLKEPAVVAGVIRRLLADTR